MRGHKQTHELQRKKNEQTQTLALSKFGVQVELIRTYNRAARRSKCVLKFSYLTIFSNAKF